MLNKVNLCGVNTSELKVLSHKEKTELLKKNQTGRRTRAQYVY